MNIKRFWKMVLVLTLALALLAGCGKGVYSSRAASAVNSAQNMVDFSTGTALDNALRKAVQAGGDLTAVRNALLEELGYQDAAYFSASGIRSARTGQHAVQVYRVSGSVSTAAESIAEEIASVLHALRSGGEYTGCISMVKYDGSCYIAVDLTIVKQAPSSSSGSDEGSGDEEPPEPTAQTIAVSGLKESYTAGDSINQDELTVSVTFSDGTTKKLGKDEYTIVYDFSSEGQQDVTITYNADPSVSCTVTVTVQAAYDGKRIAVFIGSAYCPYVGNYDSTYAEFFVSKDCEGISYNNSIYQILPSSELNTVRKSEGADGINYPTNSPLGIKMAKLRAQNQAITAEALHDSSDGYTLSDVDKIVETIQENKKNNFSVKSFIIAEVTMDNVEDLTTANKEAAKQLDQMLYEEIDQKAPEVDDTFEVTLENGETVEMEFQYAPSLLSPSVAMIREHMGGMNFKYYAVVELFGLSRQKQN